MKKSIKKLSLNKSTVTNLNPQQMGAKMGGVRRTTHLPTISNLSCPQVTC